MRASTSRQVLLTDKLAACPGDEKPLFLIAEEARRPIGEASVDDGITVAVGGHWRDPQGEAAVITQAFHTRLIDTELRFREFGAQGSEHLGREQQVTLIEVIGGQGQPARVEKALRSAG